MQRDADGWFEATVPGAQPGAAYSFVSTTTWSSPTPPPARRSATSTAPRASSTPAAYRWRHDWPGRPWHEAVILELHIGAFTDEGTFAAAAARLPEIAETGITAIEIMPVAHFAGTRGWGYDGVLPYAPHSAYGTPDELKALIDAAHESGLMVLLDVVYNHFGPDGNYLPVYAPDFFHPEHHTPWAPPSPTTARPVRRFFVENALYCSRSSTSTASASTRSTTSATPTPTPRSSSRSPRRSAPPSPTVPSI